MSTASGDEEFGYVSRDQKLLDRATSSEESTEKVEKTGGDHEFRSDQETTAGVNTPAVTPDDDEKQGESKISPPVSSRGSMASSTGSGSRASIVSVEEKVTKVKIKGTNTEITLPQSFQVKYLGRRDARGLWGIKHTRKPVDAMVAAAKNVAASSPGIMLPLVRLVVSREGVTINETRKIKDKTTTSTVAFHPIDSISYGVQDLVYTRVFSMIIVRENSELRGQHPFECHAFVCDSRAHARKLTYALAGAFHEYSQSVRAASATGSLDGAGKRAKKFAIDLRTPEQIEKDLQQPQEADSEA